MGALNTQEIEEWSNNAYFLTEAVRLFRDSYLNEDSQAAAILSSMINTWAVNGSQDYRGPLQLRLDGHSGRSPGIVDINLNSLSSGVARVLSGSVLDKVAGKPEYDALTSNTMKASLILGYVIGVELDDNTGDNSPSLSSVAAEADSKVDPNFVDDQALLEYYDVDPNQLKQARFGGAVSRIFGKITTMLMLPEHEAYAITVSEAFEEALKSPAATDINNQNLMRAIQQPEGTKSPYDFDSPEALAFIAALSYAYNEEAVRVALREN